MVSDISIICPTEGFSINPSVTAKSFVNVSLTSEPITFGSSSAGAEAE